MDQVVRVLEHIADGRIPYRRAELHAYERLLAPEVAPEVRQPVPNRAARRRMVREGLRA
jgi:hypothetical protein